MRRKAVLVVTLSAILSVTYSRQPSMAITDYLGSSYYQKLIGAQEVDGQLPMVAAFDPIPSTQLDIKGLQKQERHRQMMDIALDIILIVGLLSSAGLIVFSLRNRMKKTKKNKTYNKK